MEVAEPNFDSAIFIKFQKNKEINMKIKDVIKTAATLLGRTDVTAYLDSKEIEDGSETLQTVNVMTNLTNLVITELSSTFIPLKKTQTMSAYDGRIYYKDFNETLTRVTGVYSATGKSVDYGYHPEYITLPFNSVYTVEYEYVPSNLGLEDDACYAEKDVPSHVLAYGLAAEFCITEGSFEQAVMWHKRYVDGVEKACPPKSLTTRERRWE